MSLIGNALRRAQAQANPRGPSRRINLIASRQTRPPRRPLTRQNRIFLTCVIGVSLTILSILLATLFPSWATVFIAAGLVPLVIAATTLLAEAGRFLYRKYGSPGRLTTTEVTVVVVVVAGAVVLGGGYMAYQLMQAVTPEPRQTTTPVRTTPPTAPARPTASDSRPAAPAGATPRVERICSTSPTPQPILDNERCERVITPSIALSVAVPQGFGFRWWGDAESSVFQSGTDKIVILSTKSRQLKLFVERYRCSAKFPC